MAKFTTHPFSTEIFFLVVPILENYYFERTR